MDFTNTTSELNFTCKECGKSVRMQNGDYRTVCTYCGMKWIRTVGFGRDTAGHMIDQRPDLPSAATSPANGYPPADGDDAFHHSADQDADHNQER